jgi:hypothetical protein
MPPGPRAPPWSDQKMHPCQMPHHQPAGNLQGNQADGIYFVGTSLITGLNSTVISYLFKSETILCIQKTRVCHEVRHWETSCTNWHGSILLGQLVTSRYQSGITMELTDRRKTPLLRLTA